MTDLLTAEKDRLRRRAEGILERIAELDDEIVKRRRELAGIEGEMRGLERAAELFSEPATSPAKRRSVQPAVMAAFKPGECWTLSQLVDLINRMPREDDLPTEAIRDCLGRVVRLGKLTLSDAGYYCLPAAQDNGLVP